jgi:hypothetical protein
MTSIEFRLARLAGGSPWRDPRRPPGGRPELTLEELRAAMAMARLDGIAWVAMSAKYLQAANAEEELVDLVAKRSAEIFLAERPTFPITGNRNRAIAESAVIYFLNPKLGLDRGDPGNAAHARVSRGTWRRYYRDHWKAMTAWLYQIESSARGAIWKALR